MEATDHKMPTGHKASLPDRRVRAHGARHVREHFLVSVQQGTTQSGTPVFRTSQPTRWHADAGSEVEVTNAVTPANGTTTLVPISGCLMDA